MRKGVFSLLAAAFAWSWPSVMIRMLRTDFDVFSQSFFRYVAATVFMFAFGLIFMRGKISDVAGNLKTLLIPSVIMTVHQVFYTAGLFMTPAVISSLVGRLNAIIIPALSCVFYEDERQVVKNRGFLLGAILSFAGVLVVILGKGAEIAGGFNVGSVLVVLGTLCWSVYAVYVKKLVRSIDPLAIISYVSLLSTVFFFPLVLFFGDIRSISSASIETQSLLYGSGILGVGIGNVFYNHAVKHVGTSIASVFFLLMPLSVGVIGFLILGEALTTVQIIAGAVSILGCWIVTRLAKNSEED